MAYAKVHLPKLLVRVARRDRIVIARYNTPMAALIPPTGVGTVERKFGTGEGKPS